LRQETWQQFEVEFQRALATVELDPPAGVTAACSLIEALCKAYIEDEHLELPSKEIIKDLWRVVSKDLGWLQDLLLTKISTASFLVCFSG